MLLKPLNVEEWISTPTQIGYGPGQLSVFSYDLRDAYGSWVTLRFGRNYSTIPNSGLRFNAYPYPVGLGEGYPSHAGAMVSRNANLNGATNDVANVSLTSPGQTVIQVSGGGFVAGDRVCIFGPSGERVEWKRIVRVDGGNLYTDTPFIYEHDPATADNVVSGADIFAPFWLPGGNFYSLTLDNQNENNIGYWFAIQGVKRTAIKTYPG